MDKISQSIAAMKDIVNDDQIIFGNTYSLTTPIAAFASNSLLPMDFLVTLRANPPRRMSLIHATILNNEKLVIAKSKEVQLRQSSVHFADFKNKFLKQDVKIPTNINHIHILAFDGVNM